MLLKKSKLIGNQTVQICGSKSISNRLLILHALFENIKIENFSDAEDTKLLQAALESDSEVLDIKHAGTAMRFLTAFFAVDERNWGKTKILTGSASMKKRPIDFLVNALRDLGADIEYLEADGFPPLKITGKRISKNFVKINSNLSSQFITALMLVGAKLDDGLQIELVGKITSKPYLELTLKTLKNVGIEAQFNENTIEISPLDLNDAQSHIFHFEVESDWSSASYFYSLAAIGREIINLKSFQAHSYQADSRLKQIYWDFFGINTISDAQEHQISLIPEPFEMQEIIKIDMNDCPDIAQTVCVTAAALKIPFVITGLETLKVKETDRLVAMQNELEKIGCITEITTDSISSQEFTEHQDEINIETYCDHRMAMSFAPYCLIGDISFDDATVVEKSYPTFWADLASILMREE